MKNDVTKTYSYYIDKYTELDKESLEEKLELSELDYEAFCQNGARDPFEGSRLEEKIHAIKYLLNQKYYKKNDSGWD